MMNKKIEYWKSIAECIVTEQMSLRLNRKVV